MLSPRPEEETLLEIKYLFNFVSVVDECNDFINDGMLSEGQCIS